MKFKNTFILVQFSFLIIYSSYGQYYPVPNSKLEVQNKNLLEKIEVKSFLISHFITVNEFKTYLNSVKKDSSKLFYKAQLPCSRDIKEEMIHKILNNEKLQKKPMPGVSWSVAQNYCKWLTSKAKSIGYEFTYELPLLSEIIAYTNLYGSIDNNELQTWTLNCYDESFFEYSDFLNYQYNAKTTDPPAMKRKVIYGNSYHINYNPSNLDKKYHYEYQDSSSRYVGFRIVQRMNESKEDTLNVQGIDVDFSLVNNQLNGIYKEKYPNGKTKVIGYFINGQRSNIWSIWDEEGKIKVQRNYLNNIVFDFIFPKTNFPYQEIYTIYPEYVLIKNKQNFYPYQFVEERTVIYSKRIWREINTTNEPELFKQINFKKIVQDLMDDNVKWYHYGKNGDLKNELSKDELSKINTSYINWDYSRIEIKEDFFFNLDNLKSDTRQIAISFYNSTKSIQPDFTFYFPSARFTFAKSKYSSSMNEIKTLDDFFFYHNYRGNIIKNSNFFYDSNSKNQQDLKMELDNLVNEHNLWLNYGR